MNKKLLSKFLTVFVLLCTGSFSSAAVAGAAFSKGSTSVGIVTGSGRFGNQNYTIFGLGVGYYVANGLELGIDVQHWFSGDPAISKVSPQIRYVFNRSKTIKPYAGAFYRRTFIEDLEDDDSYGYSIGAYFSANSGVYIGGGVVYEEFQDCSRFDDCSNTYPELLISINF